MGVATTAVILGFAALQAASTIKSAEKQAKAAAEEGTLKAKQQARKTELRAASVTSSFLSSGLTLEGTPMAAIQDTFNVGLEDIGQIQSVYNAKSKAIMSQGRTKVLSGLATNAIGGMGLFQSGMGIGEAIGSVAPETTGSFLGSIGAGETAQNIGFSMNEMGMGTDAYSLIEASDIAEGIY